MRLSVTRSGPGCDRLCLDSRPDKREPRCTMQSDTIKNWHALLESRDLSGLDRLIADDAVFHSPVVHTPQVGKELTRFYLTGAFYVLFDNGFHYVREIVGEDNAALEFAAEINGIQINGIDLIHWNKDGRIDDFKVMIRPLKAVNLLHRMMGEALKNLETGA